MQDNTRHAAFELTVETELRSKSTFWILEMF